ncbi:MAG TPA: hypothetical protein VHX63_09470 [Acidobacteriaceae bacterium]|jgi:hypothetical protein|nr:hypothetical protein [Acidobacteriaceae bacterium]
MKLKLALGSTALAIAIAASGMVIAQQAPVSNIDPARHPHLAQAQRLAIQASMQIGAARTDNHEHMGGHGRRAQQLLDQVNNELKLAAEAANRNH